MCGIAGSIGPLNSSIVSAMTACVQHRGPDDLGMYVDELSRVTLGHRRLSIIDPSPAGHQPMSYADGRYWITYNGEFYNYAEIRDELQSLGHAFRTGTDTEVLLGAYAQWGERCLDRVRGMFAFAIYDRGEGMSAEQGMRGESGRLFLARDRFGIKPLYYAQVGGVFLFASELTALLASGIISRQVDHQAVWDYLSLGSIPQPRTILADVKSLLPGHVMTVSVDGDAEIRKYWDIVDESKRIFPRKLIGDRAMACQTLRDLLDESTRLHLVADVPVGAFLSGGIDSTAVVGLMGRHVSKPIKTYSIGYERQHSDFSELHWARMAANHLGTDHTEVIVSGAEVAGEYDHLIGSIDQPSLDGTNAYFVSRAARRGVTVALTGVGGDELFAGYPHFRRIRTAAQAGTLPGFRTVSRFLTGVLREPYRTEVNFLAARPVDRHASIRRLADEPTKVSMVGPAVMDAGFLRPLSESYARLLRADLDPVTEMSYVELSGYLANTLLRDLDAMSMAHGLEVRPILLDHVLASFAFALPPEWKMTPSISKAIFIDSISDLIPSEIVNRRKMGFNMPLGHWLAGPLRERALETFSSWQAAALFDPEYLNRTRADIRAGENQTDDRLWAYMMLVEWLDNHRCSL